MATIKKKWAMEECISYIYLAPLVSGCFGVECDCGRDN
jgi:hypothetical protein